MSTAVGPWVLPWIAFLAVWMALCPAAFALNRLAKHRLTAVAAAERSTLLLALATLPVTVAALVAVLGFTPWLGGMLVDRHCHADTGCGAHVPILHAGAPYALSVGALLLGTTLTLCGGVFRRLRHTQRFASALGVLAEPAPRARCEIIESPEPFAYCIGLWRPKVLISTGLERALSAEALEAVVAHEHAHAARRDNLRHGLAALALLPLGPRARRALLADLTLSSEQACDRTAIETTGNASALLGALAAMRSDRRRTPRLRTTSFGATTTLASRLAALDGSDSTARNVYVVPAIIAGVYTVATLATTYVAHHGAERLLGWLG